MKKTAKFAKLAYRAAAYCNRPFDEDLADLKLLAFELMLHDGPVGFPVLDTLRDSDDPERLIPNLTDILDQALSREGSISATREPNPHWECQSWEYEMMQEAFEAITGGEASAEDYRIAGDVLSLLARWESTGEPQDLPCWCPEQLVREVLSEKQRAHAKPKPEAELRSAWESLCEQMTAVISESLEVTRGLAREVAELEAEAA
jgi:hypothetical protein